MCHGEGGLDRGPQPIWLWLDPPTRCNQDACLWAEHTMCLAPKVSICVIGHGREGVIGNLFEESAEAVLARGLAFRTRLDAQGRCGVAHCATCRRREGSSHAKHRAAA